MRDQASHKYSTDEAIKSLKDRGFQWDKLQSYFPFGFLNQREGEYVSLLRAAVSALSNSRERELLLD